VLLPTERIPLHIFELRFRELIRGCLADRTEFGLVLEDDRGMREIGTRAAVVEVVHEFDDGRLNVVVEGGRRIRVRELTSGRSFVTAKVEPFDDEPGTADPARIERALRIFRRLVQVTQSEGIDEPAPDSPQLSFELAAKVDFGVEVKQELLELRSEPQRLARLLPLMHRAAAAIAREREVRERAATNGKVTFGA